MNRRDLRWPALAAALCLTGCPGPAGHPDAVVNTTASASPSASAAPPSTVPATGPAHWLENEELVDAVFTSGDGLAVASKGAVYTLSLDARTAPIPVKLTLTSDVEYLLGNRRERFLVVTKTTAVVVGPGAVAPVSIALDAEGPAGDVSQDGTVVALAGCPQRAKVTVGDPKCVSLYDAKTGVRSAVVNLPHDVERLDFVADGFALLARSGNRGVSLIDAKTGKMLVTVPGWNRVSGVHASGSDVAQVVGAELVVGSRLGPTHSDGWPAQVVVEGYELATGKRSYRVAPSLATFAGVGGSPPRIVVVGEVVSVFAADTGTAIASVKLPSMCIPHCAAELDDLDADRVNVFPRYATQSRLIFSLSKKTEIEGTPREFGDSLTSAKFHLLHWGDACILVRRDRAGETELPESMCLDNYNHREPTWPGFDRSSRRLVTAAEHQVWIEGLEPVAELAVLGQARPARTKPRTTP
jgi:hypothetical protein